jgi:hypothetical protein
VRRYVGSSGKVLMALDSRVILVSESAGVMKIFRVTVYVCISIYTTFGNLFIFN